MARHGVSGDVAFDMLIARTGEESGTLPRSMELVSRHLAQEAEDALCGVIDGIEPVLIAFLTVSVGFTLLSVMLPLLGIVYGL